MAYVLLDITDISEANPHIGNEPGSLNMTVTWYNTNYPEELMIDPYFYSPVSPYYGLSSFIRDWLIDHPDATITPWVDPI